MAEKGFDLDLAGFESKEGQSFLQELAVNFEKEGYQNFSEIEWQIIEDKFGAADVERIKGMLVRNDPLEKGRFIVDRTLEAGGSLSQSLETRKYELNQPE